MKLIQRKYQHDDQSKIRQFLREVFLLNNRHEFSWPLYRWDYWRWHVNENIFKFNLEAAVFLWETTDRKLVAALHPDGTGEAFLEVHPEFRCPELEVEMMSVAETQFAVTQPEGRQQLTLWAHANDSMRQDLLTRRGYSKSKWLPEQQRRRNMSEPIPDFQPAEGYTIRALGDVDELPKRSWVSWKAFHPDEPDEKYEGWDWYRNVQRAPLYRRDLDLIAVAPNGDHAAFATVWFDDVTLTAAFEPVGTHPDHQRKGLARALMAEGLRRVQDLGATLCIVGSYTERAGNLYASMGFIEYTLDEAWVKEW